LIENPGVIAIPEVKTTPAGTPAVSFGSRIPGRIVVTTVATFWPAVISTLLPGLTEILAFSVVKPVPLRAIRAPVSVNDPAVPPTGAAHDPAPAPPPPMAGKLTIICPPALLTDEIVGAQLAAANDPLTLVRAIGFQAGYAVLFVIVTP